MTWKMSCKCGSFSGITVNGAVLFLTPDVIKRREEEELVGGGRKGRATRTTKKQLTKPIRCETVQIRG